jgi:predicted lipoprotein with Yx(FWY)xxD motif
MKNLLKSSLVVVSAVSSISIGFAQTSSSPSPSPSASASPSPIVLNTANGPLGTYLVDGQGLSLYLYSNDPAGLSHCTGPCATEAPPLALATNQSVDISGSVDSALIGTTTRNDGSQQVNYNTHPLYHYSGDTASGMTNGENVSTGDNNFFYLVSPDGQPIISSVSQSPSPSVTASPSASPTAMAQR